MCNVRSVRIVLDLEDDQLTQVTTWWLTVHVDDLSQLVDGPLTLDSSSAVSQARSCFLRMLDNYEKSLPGIQQSLDSLLDQIDPQELELD